MTISEATVQVLVQKCLEARLNSYSPYSKFRVGAALLDTEGNMWGGCNVENCAYPAGICAERTAYVKAASEGKRDFVAIAISSDMQDSFIYPCGVCRQFMAEFGTDLLVISTKPDASYESALLSELLPKAFTPKHLTLKRIS